MATFANVNCILIKCYSNIYKIRPVSLHIVTLYLFFAFSTGLSFGSHPNSSKPAVASNPILATLDLQALQWPSSAPTSYEELAKLTFLDPQDWFELTLPNTSAKYFHAPDKGIIRKLSHEQWIWNRQDGGIVSQTANAIRLEYKGHTVTHFFTSERTRWAFPDGSFVEKAPTLKPNSPKYHSVGPPSEDRSFQSLVDTKRWGLREVYQPPYRFFAPEAALPYVQAYLESDKPDQLQELINGTFDLKSKDDITIIIPGSLADYNAYVNQGKTIPAGGRSYAHGIVMYSDDMFELKDFTADQRKYFAQNATFDLPVHEITHHLLTKATEQKSLGFAQQRHPGLFFSEGVAEFITSQLNRGYRAQLFQEFYHRLDSDDLPKITQLNTRENRNAYIFGAMMCYYMESQGGTKALSEYFHLTSEGMDKNVAMRGVMGKDVEAVYSEMLSYYQLHRETIEELMRSWEQSSLPKIAFLKGTMNAMEVEAMLNALPSSAHEISAFPNLIDVFAMDSSLLSMPGNGVFQGPHGEIVRFRKRPTTGYTVTIRDLEVTHFLQENGSPQMVRIQHKGHTIHSYPNGTHEWFLPDGTFASFAVHGQRILGKL